MKPIPITSLTDFLFCPYSRAEEETARAIPQLAGTKTHKSEKKEKWKTDGKKDSVFTEIWTVSLVKVKTMQYLCIRISTVCRADARDDGTI